MAANWHYATGGEKHGPVTASQLKELATTGKLSPDDLVWREDMTEWRKASTVKGLFSDQPTTAIEKPPHPKAGKHDASGESVPLWERPVILVLLVTCCFPVGLFLLWRSPRIATKYKAIGTGAFVGIALIGFMLPSSNSSALSERHFPYDLLSTRKMHGGTSLELGNRYATYEVTHSGKGVITRRMTYHQSTLANGEIVRLPLLPESSDVRRVRNGFIEIRSSDFIGKEEDGWTPLIKIGAEVGDSWAGAFDGQRFTFTGYQTKRLRNRDIQCAVVEERIDGPVSTRTEFLFSKDIGLVSETVYQVKDGTETYVRQLLLEGL